jgi:D-aminoacyl-tRNA deacylase
MTTTPHPAGAPTFVLVASSKNLASMTMASALIRKHGFESSGIRFGSGDIYQSGSAILATIDSEIIYPPDLDAYFRPQAYIFLSTHRAESGIPSLTVHTTGNFTDKEVLGARPKEVGAIDPDLQKNYLIALNERKSQLEGYEITIEATHHGPTSLRRPVLFVELGSTEKQWGDAHAAEVVADALMASLASGKKWDRVALAFGGTHYPQKFNEVLLEGDCALSAVVAKRYLEWIDGEMFGQIIQRTSKFPRQVLVDWKGAGPHREKIILLSKQFALEVVRV